MLIKFLGHGTGNAHAAARYLVGTHDHNGIERADVRVLRGDPAAVAQVADSLDFKHRYTSGVIAFAGEDEPTDLQINEVLDDFERAAFAGLSKDRISYSAILHAESDGKKHIHIFAARVDLATGKSLNIAPPGWEKSYDPLRDHYNHKYGWAKPDDPARARTQQPGHVALIDAADLRRGVQVEPDPKALITQYIEQRIKAGKIDDRAGVLDALKDAGFKINREGKDYISIRDAETGEKIRLKGAIYEQDFTPGRAIEITDRARAGSARKPDQRRAESARKELEAAIDRRSEYNEGRYKIRERPVNRGDKDSKDAGRSAHQQAAEPAYDVDAMANIDNDRTVQLGNSADVALASGSSIQRENGNLDDEQQPKSDSHHQSRLDDMHTQQSTVSVPIQSIGEQHERNRNRDASIDSRRPPSTVADMPRLSTVGSVHAARGPGQSLLQSDALGQLRQPGSRPNHELQQVSAGRPGSVSNDRNRNAVTQFVEDIERRIRGAGEALNRAVERCKQALGHHDEQLSDLAKADRELVAASKDLKRGAAKMIENRADELEIFKTKISLSEYAEVYGFALDRRASSKHCHVMRAGDEKIVITRGKDGHDVYFNVRDERDSGSIVDFLQKRERLNLGQVRKELRPWAGLKGPRVESVKRRRPEQERIDRPAPIERDRAEFIASFHRLTQYTGDYLTRERKIKQSTIDAFAGVLRQDPNGNACFLHCNQAGEVTGWEIKNRGFTGYSTGGSKALVMHMPDGERVRRVLIVESTIDAMSYYQRHGRDGDLYVSIAGTMSDTQKQHLRNLVSDAPAVAIATDNDKQGNEYAATVRQWRSDAERETPSYGKDWNDELRHYSTISKSYGHDR